MPIYDVENRFSYYKSYSDNIAFGPSKPSVGSSTWDRFTIGSIVSGSLEYLAENIYSKCLYEFQNQFFRSGEVRYIRLSSATQTIQDSKVPDPVGLYTTGSYGSGSVVLLPSNGLILGGGINTYGLLFSRDGNIITGSNHERINNTEWNTSFPFEKKYRGVSRDLTQERYKFNTQYVVNTFATDIFQAGTLPADAENYKIIFAETITGSFLGIPNIKTILYNLNALCVFGIPNPTFFFGSTFGDLRSANSFIFGIKPKYNLLLIGSSPGVDAGLTGANNDYLTGSSISYSSEGWKYGLYNGLTTNFSAVFRQNHYGQFRDMLEQRIYTKTYNNPLIGGPMDNNGGINFISGSALLGESNDYITASIYASDNVTEAYRVNPYGSGIFDKEYRASQPWYDNDPRVGT